MASRKEIDINPKVLGSLEILRESGATEADLARSLRDTGASIDYAETALNSIGIPTARKEDKTNILIILENPMDGEVIDPQSEIIDWDEIS